MMMTLEIVCIYCRTDGGDDVDDTSTTTTLYTFMWSVCVCMHAYLSADDGWIFVFENVAFGVSFETRRVSKPFLLETFRNNAVKDTIYYIRIIRMGFYGRVNILFVGRTQCEGC